MEAIISILAALAGSPVSPAGEAAGAREEAIFGGTLTFGKPETAELYRRGLEEMKGWKYADAEKTFRKAKAGTTQGAEAEALERLAKEAHAGIELERIRKIAATKGAETRAFAEVAKAIPKVKGLRIAAEFEKLEEELIEILFYVIDDFEEEPASPPAPSAKPEGDGAGGGDAGKSLPKVDRKRGSITRHGAIGKGFEARLAGGEIQSAKRGGPDKVRQGECSYRWPVGKELRAKLLEIEAGTLPRYGYLDFSLRGTAGKTAVVQVALAHENVDALQFALGKFRGYSTSIAVKGAAWKDYRLSIDKDFIPKDEPEKDRVVYVIFTVKNQAQQVLYLDDVKLEK